MSSEINMDMEDLLSKAEVIRIDPLMIRHIPHVHAIKWSDEVINRRREQLKDLESFLGVNHLENPDADEKKTIQWRQSVERSLPGFWQYYRDHVLNYEKLCSLGCTLENLGIGYDEDNCYYLRSGIDAVRAKLPKRMEYRKLPNDEKVAVLEMIKESICSLLEFLSKQSDAFMDLTLLKDSRVKRVEHDSYRVPVVTNSLWDAKARVGQIDRLGVLGDFLNGPYIIDDFQDDFKRKAWQVEMASDHYWFHAYVLGTNVLRVNAIWKAGNRLEMIDLGYVGQNPQRFNELLGAAKEALQGIQGYDGFTVDKKIESVRPIKAAIYEIFKFLSMESPAC